MIHITNVEWHDLLENPMDLPKEPGNYSIVLMDKETKRMYDVYDDKTFYFPISRVWAEASIDRGRINVETYFESYGVPPIASGKYEVDEKRVVVAWAKKPAKYIPKIN